MDNKIAAVDRALEVLDLLHENEKEMGISEIARALNLHKSTVSRTLSTLEHRGFVRKNLENQKYWLGLKLYAIGMTVKEKSVYLDEVIIAAKTLFKEFNEVINVSVLEHQDEGTFKSVIVYKESNPNQVLLVNPTLGSYTDAHASSVGKCLLAYTPEVTEEYIRGLTLKKYTEKTISNNEKLIQELADIRKKGYAVDDEEREVGLTCVGAPIFDVQGNLVAAISISGPTARMKSHDREYLVKRLIQVAKSIKII
ncbi:MAG: IclR family transcriptional regulator [Peptostreptococcaceae bacterium]|nr:IclR family transcriptional regulator [Peptostreptococcaceae bacterium]